MWTREQLKTRAKSVLKKYYWKAFLVSIVLAIAGGNDIRGSVNFKFGRDDVRNFNAIDGEMFSFFMLSFFIIVVAVIIGAICFRVFLGYPLEVGGRRYFVRSAEGYEDMNNLGYSFKKGRYINIVKAMFYRGVLTFLWTLLLIIPGIVKSYAYRMVPYILGDNPHIGYERAVELSNQMTYGEKFDMFVLDLSFLGWYILGMLALFVGVIFVMPYENATKAELYIVLRQRAIDDGLCTWDELHMEV